MTQPAVIVARVGTAGFRYNERHFSSTWFRDDAALSEWLPSGMIGLRCGVRRWIGRPSGVILFLHRENTSSTSLLVSLDGDDGSTLKLPLCFSVNAAGGALLFKAPSPRHIPLHHSVSGHLGQGADGRLAWWCDEVGLSRRALVHETLIAALRENRSDPVMRWHSRLVVSFLQWSWVASASRLLAPSKHPERALWMEPPGEGMEPFMRHFANCAEVANGGACIECVSLSRKVKSSGTFWRDVLELISVRGPKVDRANAYSEAPKCPPPTEAERQSLVDDVAVLMRTSGASKARRRSAIDRLAGVDLSWLLGAMPAIFEKIRVERGTVSNAPWSLLFCLRSPRLLDGNAMDDLCDSGWSGGLNHRQFQRTVHAILAEATPAAERTLAAMAYWEVSSRRWKQIRPPLVSRVLELCQEPAAAEARPVLQTIAHPLVGLAIEAQANLNPLKAERQLALHIAETEQLLRALPAGSVHSRNQWFEAYRRLPWMRQRLIQIAATVDPTSPAHAFWSNPEAGPRPEELASAVAEPEAATQERWQTLLSWAWTSLSLPATRAALPPLPHLAADGSVAGSVSYWKAFSWGLPLLRGRMASELWRWLVPAIVERFRAHPDPETENNAWLAFGEYLERRYALRAAAWTSLVLSRFEELIAFDPAQWAKRPITVLRALSALLDNSETYGQAFESVEPRYRGVGDEGFRQRCLTMLERRKDLAQLIVRPSVRDALVEALESPNMYIAVSAVRCIAAAARVLHAVDWLHQPRDHGEFWKRQLGSGVLSRWALHLKAEPFSPGVWRARYIEWLSAVARGTGMVGFYKDVGKHTAVLRSLEQFDGVAAQKVAQELAREKIFGPVSRWLAERGQWPAHLHSVLEVLLAELPEAPEAEFEPLAKRLALLSRRGFAAAVPMWPPLVVAAQRRLAMATSALASAQLLAALAAAPPGTAGRFTIEVQRKAREILSQEPKSRARYFVYQLLGAVALETAEPPALLGGTSHALHEVVAAAVQWIESASPTETFGQLARFFEEQSRSAVISENLVAIAFLVGGAKAALGGGVKAALGTAARTALLPAVSLPQTERNCHIERMRSQIDEQIAKLQQRIIELPEVAAIPLSALLGQLEANDTISKSLMLALGDWSNISALGIEALWRGLRLRRLCRVLQSADLVLHDLRYVDAAVEIQRQLTHFEAEIQLVDDPDVQRYENILLLAQDLLHELLPIFTGAIELELPPPSEMHREPKSVWLSIDDLERLFHNLLSNALRHGEQPVNIEFHATGVRFRNGVRAGGPPAEYWEQVTRYLAGATNSGLEESSFPPHSGLRAIRHIRYRNPALTIQVYCEQESDRDEVVFAVHFCPVSSDSEEPGLPSGEQTPAESTTTDEANAS